MIPLYYEEALVIVEQKNRKKAGKETQQLLDQVISRVGSCSQ
jgi:hypothetical protein